MSIPRAQDFYKHFKGKIYQIVTTAEHTETGEILVIYQAMYDDFKIYARPLSMFTEKVDKSKYPEATQEYRFEKIAAICAEGEKASMSEAESSMPVEKKEEARIYSAVAQPEEIGSEEAELQLDPLLLDFLDADTYEEKLSVLAAVHPRITDDMITTMAIACDVEVAEGSLESRYSQLKNCLLTLDRYEINRVR